MKKKIIIVDDHEVVRLGLKSLLDQYSEYEVISEARNANEVIRQVDDLDPDIILMDIRLPGKSGIEACEERKNQILK